MAANTFAKMASEKPVRILYVSYDGMTDPLGQSQVIPYLAGLSQRGYRFTILSCEKQARFQANKEKIKVLLEKHNIAWVPLTYHKKPPVFSSLYDLFSMRKIACRLHKKEDFQIVHCRSYIPGLIGMYMKKKYSTKFVFDMRGFWADERVEGNIWSLKNPLFKAIYRFFKNKERKMLTFADCTISLTNAAKKEIHSWEHIPNQPIPIEVIPCCVDTELFDRNKINHDEQKKLRDRLGIHKDQKVLTYLGSLGTWYPLEEMLKFFKSLLKQNPSYIFLFITKTPETLIYEQVKKLQISCSKVIATSAERKEIPLYLSLSNLSVFFYYPTFSKKATSPTKMGEIMSMDIPFVTNRGIGDIDAIVENTRCGLLVSKFDEGIYAKIAERVEEVLTLPSNVIRGYSRKYFDIEDGISKYQDAYLSLQELIVVQ